jgi:hypothetical protein
MYCDGNNWQIAMNGEPCAMLDSGMAGQGCSYGRERTIALAIVTKTIKGIEYIEDTSFNPPLYFWKSNADGSDFHGKLNQWCCPQGAFVFPPQQETNPSGETYWAITVYVTVPPHPVPAPGTPQAQRTIHGRKLTKHNTLHSYCYSSLNGKNHEGNYLWCFTDDAVVPPGPGSHNPTDEGESTSHEPCSGITIYTKGKAHAP